MTAPEVDFIAALEKVTGRQAELRHERPLSDAQIAEEMRQEAIAEDRAFMRQFGGTDQDADHAALVEENRRERYLQERGIA